MSLVMVCLLRSLADRSVLCEFPSPGCLCGLSNVYLFQLLCDLDFMFFMVSKKIASAVSFSSERFIIIDSILSRGCLPL